MRKIIRKITEVFTWNTSVDAYGSLVNPCIGAY